MGIFKWVYEEVAGGGPHRVERGVITRTRRMEL